jgi:6-phosphogluconolactonase (cycloisomerase 2 family)
MTHRSAFALLCALLALTLVGTQAAAAGRGHGRGHHKGGHGKRVVFVQTNELSGNRIVVYDRRPGGQLVYAGSYVTGGKGGAALPGAESDHLASQGSLVFDKAHRLLLAVNAGSNTVSAFRVRGDRLALEGVWPSGGEFPASIGIHGDLAYVLSSGGDGVVKGFRVGRHGLWPIPGSARSLGLGNSSPPNFLTSPGQVGFTPDGRKLLVTTKASTSSIDVFHVRFDGRLSSAPVVNPSATPVPFAFTFDRFGRLVSGEAGASTVTTYRIQPGGILTDPKSQGDGQAALCWILRVGGFYYVSNTASDNLSGYRIDAAGQPSLLTTSGIVATTNPGPIDLASSGSYLYAQTGLNGTVDEFSIVSDGSLSPIGSVTGLPPGLEGIAAS